MSDLFIIVTRMSGTGENEFNSYFNNTNWAVKYNQSTTCKIPTEQAELLYDNNDSIIFANGFSVNNNDGKCNALRDYISAGSHRNIYMLIHPGQKSLEQAKQKIFKCNNDDQASITQNKIEIQEYSSMFAGIMEIVEQLAKCINSNEPEITCQTDKIKDYVLKKKRNLILNLFLSLDIDMQALEILSTRSEEGTAVEYLKAMCKSVEDGFYKEKYLATQQLMEQMPDAKRIKLKTLIDSDDAINAYLFNFLSLLDSNKDKQLRREDVEAVTGYFKVCCNDGIWHAINSFHKWYAELSCA